LFILAYCQSKYARTLPDKGSIRSAQTQFRRFSTMRNIWPARPGQQQYEWEEPRVVVQSDTRRQKEHQLQTAGIKQPNKRQAQSRLGRAVDGTACRVDRLRLLGNGVVPQQAETAFSELWEKIQR